MASRTSKHAHAHAMASDEPLLSAGRRQTKRPEYGSIDKERDKELQPFRYNMQPDEEDDDDIVATYTDKRPQMQMAANTIENEEDGDSVDAEIEAKLQQHKWPRHLPPSTHRPGQHTKALQKFLADHTCSPLRSTQPTHVSLAGGSYIIDTAADLSIFDHLYATAIWNEGYVGRISEVTYGMANIPSLLDLDWSLTASGRELGFHEMIEQPSKEKMDSILLKWRHYTLTSALLFAYEWIQELSKFTIQPLTGSVARIYILEKPAPTLCTAGSIKNEFGYSKYGKNDRGDDMYKIKDGIHIMMPGLIVPKETQLLVRDRILKSRDAHSIFATFLKMPVDAIPAYLEHTPIIDAGVLTGQAPWPMYGSRRAEKRDPYLISLCVEPPERGDTPTMCRPARNNLGEIDYACLVDELNVQLCVRDGYIPVKSDLAASDAASAATGDFSKRRRMAAYGQSAISDRIERKIERKGDLEIVKRYVNCLSAKTATDYNSWIQVGWCLYNIHNVDDELLNAWILFSQKSYKQEHRQSANVECRALWSKFKTRNLGLPSLKMWAKRDNERAYDSVRVDELHEAARLIYEDAPAELLGMRSGLKPVHFARMLHRTCGDMYICVVKTKHQHIWYAYKERIHRWVEDNGGIELYRYLSDDFVKTYTRLIEKMTAELASGQLSQGDSFLMTTMKTRFTEVLQKFDEDGFIDRIVNQASVRFYDKERAEEFMASLDNNDDVIVCKNGVFDFVEDTFRAGRPDDYATKSTGKEFKPFDTYPIETRSGIWNFLISIMPITRVRDYMLKKLASCVCGTANSETFDILTGRGANGKSKLFAVCQGALGGYCDSIKSTVLTTKQPTQGSANCDLMDFLGIRMALIEEPEPSEVGKSEVPPLNEAFMKEMTGAGAGIKGRGLYKGNVRFSIHARIFIGSNEPLKVNSNSESIERRLLNTEFISRFMKPNVFVRQNMLHFRRDDSMTHLFKEVWPPAFLALLIDIYRESRNKPIVVPPEIIYYSVSYREQFSEAALFKNERLSEEGAVVLTAQQIFKEYLIWASDQKRKPSSIGTFISALTRTLPASKQPTCNRKGETMSCEAVLNTKNVALIKELKFRCWSFIARE